MHGKPVYLEPIFGIFCKFSALIYKCFMCPVALSASYSLQEALTVTLGFWLVSDRMVGISLVQHKNSGHALS